VAAGVASFSLVPVEDQPAHQRVYRLNIVYSDDRSPLQRVLRVPPSELDGES